MVGLGGIGPSTGRLVEVCESSEIRFRRARSTPPVIWALVFAAVFLGVLSGMTLIYLSEVVLGAILLTVPFALILLLVIRSIRAPR